MTYGSKSYSGNYLENLGEKLKTAKGDSALFDTIVNAPFEDKISATMLGLGVVVFLLVNKKTHMIDRVALSRTEVAMRTIEVSAKPFEAIKIPIDYSENIIAKAIKTQRHQQTQDWQHLFVPALKAEDARFMQANAGLDCSVVYPLKARGGGGLIFSYFIYPEDLTDNHFMFMKRYAALVDQKLT